MKNRLNKNVLLIVLLLSAGIVSSQTNLGFYQEYYETRSFEAPTEYTSITLDSIVTPDFNVTIHLSDTIATVLPTQFGVNTPFRNGPGIISRAPIYNDGHFGVFRFPAGSGSNEYFWDGVIPDDFAIPPFGPISGATGLNSELFSVFLDSTGTRATFVVNYFYARYGLTDEGTRAARVSQAAGYGASWVRYMNYELNANIEHWEVGNECYGPWEVGYEVDGSIVNGTEYGEDFRVFADSMKAADPTIKVGAVLHNNGGSSWNPQVLAEVEDHADFLVIHNYFVGFSPTGEQILNASKTKIENLATMIRGQVEEHTDKPADYYPITLTEYNSRGAHTITMLNGIFFTHVIGELIKNEYGMATSWVSEWGLKPPDYDWTHGIISTPADESQEPYTPRPAYMPYHLYGKCFGGHMVSSSSTDSVGMSFVSVFDEGHIGLVITNPTDVEKVVALEGLPEEVDKMFWYEFYANDTLPGNTKFYLNDETSATDGGGVVDFDNVPFYGAEMNGNERIILKPWSSNFFVITLPESEVGEVKSSINNDGIHIYPNPAEDVLYVSLDKAQIGKVLRIFDTTGKLIYETVSNTEMTIDLSRFHRGTYVLSVDNQYVRFIVN
ncbi:MAG: hypothetical protein ACI8ZM_003007 [Crocinitomix sp.]